MKLTERLTEQCVIVDSQKTTWRDVVGEMVDCLCKAHGLETRDKIMAAVSEREKLMSTGIGCGLAVPHA